MPGTCSALALVAGKGCAVVFRADYAKRGLVGRCLDPQQEPLVSFTAQQLEQALALSVSIVEARKEESRNHATPY